MSTNIGVERPVYEAYTAGYYNAKITDVVEEPNPFYGKDPERAGTKNRLTFSFDFTYADGSIKKIKVFMSPLLTPKSKFTKLCSVVIPNFTIQQNPTVEDLKGKECRILIKNRPKQGTGEMQSYVDDFDPASTTPLA